MRITMGVEEKMAAILGVGTANPTNCIRQEGYADFYFRVTNSDHLTDLKHKFIRFCEKSGIEKLYMLLSEDILRENPSLLSHGAPSLKAREKISEVEIPKLGKEAALKAIEEWGQPKSNITHLIFCSIQAVHMPGADLHLAVDLGLRRSVRRVMLYDQGCYVSVSALRLAKDFAENNHGARVLVVYSDMTIGSFRAPREDDKEDLIMQSTLGDGAAAVVVGADVDETRERPLFRIVSGAQTIIPDSKGAICGHVSENGFLLRRKIKDPGFLVSTISSHINDFLTQIFRSMGIETTIDWNSVFWVMQPTAKPVLDSIEEELKLEKDKLEVSREMWREYGYMMSSSVLFVPKKIQKRFSEQRTEVSEYGVLFGFGTGLTLEALVLRHVPLPTSLGLAASV